MLCFMLYLDLFRKDYYDRKGSLSLLFALMMFYTVVTAVMVSENLFNVYILPYAMLPVIIRVFLDSRTAFLTHVITILVCSICLRYPHEFILLQIAAGLVAIYSLRELSQRSQLFRTAVLVILTYAALYFAFEMITENDVSKLNGRMYMYFIINGIFLLFTYPLLFVLEKTFGFTSNVTLVELSNINTPLLRTTTLHLEGGHDFRIVAEGLSEKNCYIQSATLNGQDYPYSTLRHKDLTAGGTLVLKMGKKPSEWGKEMFKPEK